MLDYDKDDASSIRKVIHWIAIGFWLAFSVVLIFLWAFWFYSVVHETNDKERSDGIGLFVVFT
jgi:membrane protein implicated in regulation of membrane protease activity